MFQSWFNRLKNPSLDWIQVEVSSHCNAGCLYCPHTLLHDQWKNQHLSLDLFERLVPCFPKTDLVFLQGWGEPFLCPDLMQMIALAKDAGCRVGTTTNGMLLDEKMVQQLITLQLDILCISLAGVDSANDRLRKGTSLRRLLDTLGMISDMKKQNSSHYPKINIAYLLLHSGLDDVNQLPDMLAGLGIADIILSTLDFVPEGPMAKEVVRPRSKDAFNALDRQLRAVREKAKAHGINLCYHLVNPTAPCQVCTENIEKAVFISSTGAVSPCVFTNLPITFDENQADGRFTSYQPLIFGNINELTLPEIWQSKDYKQFRASFVQYSPPAPCKTCPKLFIGC